MQGIYEVIKVPTNMMYNKTGLEECKSKDVCKKEDAVGIYEDGQKPSGDQQKKSPPNSNQGAAWSKLKSKK